MRIFMAENAPRTGKVRKAKSHPDTLRKPQARGVLVTLTL